MQGNAASAEKEEKPWPVGSKEIKIDAAAIKTAEAVFNYFESLKADYGGVDALSTFAGSMQRYVYVIAGLFEVTEKIAANNR